MIKKIVIDGGVAGGVKLYQGLSGLSQFCTEWVMGGFTNR
jgi:hypothetical protein